MGPAGNPAVGDRTGVRNRGRLAARPLSANPANRGKVLDRGLWRYTRHPNYFGDFCVWWGMYAVAACGGAWTTFFSPLMMSIFLLFVSGVRLTEKDIGQRRPEYDAYRRQTNAFFPGPPKLAKLVRPREASQDPRGEYSHAMDDCIIIGGGIIGLSLAVELHHHGRQVRILDRRRTRHIASWAAAGILPPPIARAVHDPLEQIRELSHRLYEPWCEQLTEATGIDVPYQRCGGVYVGRKTGEKVSLRAALEQWREDGVQVETWSAEQLQAVEPNLVALPSSAVGLPFAGRSAGSSAADSAGPARVLRQEACADPRTGACARLGRVVGRYRSTAHVTGYV